MRGHNGAVSEKAYVHGDFKGSNPLYVILFHSAGTATTLIPPVNGAGRKAAFKD
jgi:hypothetical protein